MPSTSLVSHSDNRRNEFITVSRVGPRTRDAMIAAAAAMAMADGCATPAEHRGLVAFLKQNKMLFSLGRAETVERYTAELRRAVGSLGEPLSSQDRWRDLNDRLRPIAGMEAAHLVAAAAACVAAADGVVQPGEMDLLRALRDALGLQQPAIDAHPRDAHPDEAHLDGAR
jgi:tellurite resistance protein